MSFLPLVQRELRAAARRKSTFRIRFWTAAFAMCAGFSSLLVAWLSPGRGSAGAPLFSALSGYAFFLCFIAGLFFTADTLSQEKREGTLGLLLLANLGSYDVVLGKFCAASLEAVYGLLALLPFLGLPLLLGGVTGSEFGRMALAMVNALFFSLAVGLCFSAFARDARHATGATFAVLLVAAVIVPGLDELTRLARLAPGWSLPAWLSPFSAFSTARESTYSADPPRFWLSLVASHLTGWLGLGLASLTLSRSEWALALPADRSSLQGRPWRRHRAGKKRGPRGGLLDSNPVKWLALLDTGLQPITWLVVAVWSVVVLLTAMRHVGDPAVLLHRGLGATSVEGAAAVFGFLLKSLCALQATRFFMEARRQGMLEILLCTPVTNRDLVKGQSQALKKSFGPPATVFVVLLCLPVLTQLGIAWAALDWSQLWSGAFSLFLTFIFCVRLGADLVAVALVGIWLAASLRQPKYAAVLTVVYVLVLPSVLCWLDVFADALFIAWTTTRLRADLRRVLAHPSAPTVLIAAPPIICAPRPPVIQS